MKNIKKEQIEQINELMNNDLIAHGLCINDIYARISDISDLTQENLDTKTQAYSFPYFGIDGKQIGYNRLRIFNQNNVFSKTKIENKHIYFPKIFKEYLEKDNILIITNDERKSVLLSKLGYLSCAISDSSNWKMNQCYFKDDYIMDKVTIGKTNLIKVTVDKNLYSDNNTIIKDIEDLHSIINRYDLKIYFQYSYNFSYDVYGDDQTNMAEFAHELNMLGLLRNNIKQIKFDYQDSQTYMDFYTKEIIDKLLKDNDFKFPFNPNIKQIILSNVHYKYNSRSAVKKIANIILSDLEAKGEILFCKKQQEFYYFDNNTKILSLICYKTFETRAYKYASAFVNLLFNDYGLTKTHSRITAEILNEIYSLEENDLRQPLSIFYNDDNNVYLQLDNTKYIHISANNMNIVDNGYNNIFFKENSTDKISISVLMKEIDIQSRNHLEFKWFNLLKEYSSQNNTERQIIISSLLHYIYPWFNNNVSVIPKIELYLSPYKSYKNVIQDLRKYIITGEVVPIKYYNSLSQIFKDMQNINDIFILKDSQNLLDKLQRHLYDNLESAVIEQDSSMRHRKFYFSCNSSIVLTADKLTFDNEDLEENCEIFHFKFDKRYNTKNKTKKILKQNNGREGFLANHILFISKFLNQIQGKGELEYDEILKIGLNIFNIDEEKIIETKIEKDVKKIDEIIEILSLFKKDYGMNKPFISKDVYDWCLKNDMTKINKLLPDYNDLDTFIEDNGINKFKSVELCFVEPKRYAFHLMEL